MSAAPCQWCGKPSVKKVVIEGAQYTREKKLKRRAIEADVCARHERMVYRDAERRDLTKKRDELRLKLRVRLDPSGAAAGRAREALEKAERRLGKLDADAKAEAEAEG